MRVLRHVFWRLRAVAIGSIGLLLAVPALAQAPHNWQLGFQPPFSPTQRAIEDLHALVLWLMAVVTIFVAALLGYVIWKFRSSVNPKASRTSHHTVLEVAWTVLPVLILVLIAIPSFRVIYYQDRTSAADMTLKVIGHQWYWEYQYPDQGDLKFDSYMVQEADLKPGQLRQLEVDNQVVLPAGKNVRILITGADVIHSFFIPSLGVQRYAIPGRTIETWVRVDQPGTYYGQCNQVCGTNHSAMPISVRALTEPEFAAWVEEAKTKFAEGATSFPVREPTRLAVAEQQR